mmetsp:Transcript_16821/g.41385  ORF Transcript_16821/g.41385 Transcript_16821/m.41385 type:complete len:813 (-) Transcript_16821:178-2616(-)|eukprot:CAMPEP_0114497392 /NCGR_PEP_ID=MMETSP0109-20121206/6302_1 /TAXON_ID=29199 /ORGANISM="Chlorarachnion reptans, Strain CCCM449" /LENGTH=812 /DNA_ID=CAMNT_0001674775 /DNA_START=218 /DNA_END=2656 /DNA_ORIENTATION=-
MPFVIPLKRTGVSHGVYMNKYVSEYKSMQKRKYFALQRKKPPVLGFGILASQDRPTYRIVTRGLGNHHIYDIAYSDSLEDIRNNEWHYCIHELEKVMPKFDDMKTKRKWLVAHFTTLAISLGNTAENRYFDGNKTTAIMKNAKSEPDFGTAFPQNKKRHSLGSIRTHHDIKTETKKTVGRLSQRAVRYSAPMPRQENSPKHQAPPTNIKSDHKDDDNELNDVGNLESDAEIKQKNPLDATLTQSVERKARTKSTLTSPPTPLEVTRRGTRAALDTGESSSFLMRDRYLTPRSQPAPESPATDYETEETEQFPAIMLPFHGKFSFVVSTSLVVPFMFLAREASSITFTILLIFVVSIIFFVTIMESPASLHLHLDIPKLYRVGRPKRHVRAKAYDNPGHAINTPAIHHRRTRNLDPRDFVEAKMKRERQNGLGRLNAHLPLALESEEEPQERRDSMDMKVGFVKPEESDEEDMLVGVQISVLPNPSSEGDVIRLTLEVCGVPIKPAEIVSPRGRRSESLGPGERSESMLGVKRLLMNSARIMAGVTTAYRTKRKWEKIDPSTFKLRCGPNYRRNGFKKPSDGAFYDIGGVDVFRSDGKKYISNIGNKVDLSELTDGKEGYLYGLPRIWIVVLQIPAYAPSVLGSVNDGDGFAICFYFKLNEMGLAAAKEGKGASKVMKKFLSEPLTISDADRGPHQWKNIVRLANAEDLQLGWVLNSYVTKYNAKPFLSRNCKSYFRGPSHFEVDVDIHRFNYVSRQGMYSFRTYLKQLTLDIGFVVQCDTDDEMPEKLLGCCRLKGMDAENDAVPLPSSFKL